jgi:hypothetical protein
MLYNIVLREGEHFTILSRVWGGGGDIFQLYLPTLRAIVKEALFLCPSFCDPPLTLAVSLRYYAVKIMKLGIPIKYFMGSFL